MSDSIKPYKKTEFNSHPLFAALYDRIMYFNERNTLGRLRESIVSGSYGMVLEIGIGTGANFPYYKKAKYIVALEPDVYMMARAEKKAKKLKISVQFQNARAEELPFPDESLYTVVGTLVLCSVKDPDKALKEMFRVLQSGGEYLFIEHIRHNDWRGILEDILTPLWSKVASGCHLNRLTIEYIKNAGFNINEISYGSIFPGLCIVAGIAKKPEVVS